MCINLENQYRLSWLRIWQQPRKCAVTYVNTLTQIHSYTHETNTPPPPPPTHTHTHACRHTHTYMCTHAHTHTVHALTHMCTQTHVQFSYRAVKV